MSRPVRTVAVLTIATLLALGAMAPTAAADSSDRPFSGTVLGGGAVAEDAGCPIGLRTLGWGTGTATHLGVTTITANHCTPNPPFGPAPGPIVGGDITFVAANGDAVEGTYTGTVGPLEPVDGAAISLVMHVEITGGTGRFAGATGHVKIDAAGILHFETPMTVTWTWEGRLGY